MMDYEKILEVCEKATEGPWMATAVSGEWDVDENAIISMDLKVLTKNISVRQSRNDAYFITIARTALPELVERCMALEKVANKANEFIKSIPLVGSKEGRADYVKMVTGDKIYALRIALVGLEEW